MSEEEGPRESRPKHLGAIKFFVEERQDPYEVLGTSREEVDASQHPDDLVKKVYRRQARQSHPDVAEDGEEEFLRVGLAYDALETEETRDAYKLARRSGLGAIGIQDAQGAQGAPEQSSWAGDWGFPQGGIFGGFGFGDFFTGRRARARTGGGVRARQAPPRKPRRAPPSPPKGVKEVPESETVEEGREEARLRQRQREEQNRCRGFDIQDLIPGDPHEIFPRPQDTENWDSVDERWNDLGGCVVALAILEAYAKRRLGDGPEALLKSIHSFVEGLGLGNQDRMKFLRRLHHMKEFEVFGNYARRMTGQRYIPYNPPGEADERVPLREAVRSHLEQREIVALHTTRPIPCNDKFRAPELKSDWLSPDRVYIAVGLGQVEALDGGPVDVIRVIDTKRPYEYLFISLDILQGLSHSVEILFAAGCGPEERALVAVKPEEEEK